MAVMDEFKEEREQMKQQPLKKRLEYFWYYHKYHVIAALFAAFFVGDFIYTNLTQKDNVFMAALIDCYTNEEAATEFETMLLERLDVNPEEESIIINSSLFISNATDTTSFEILMVRIAAGELDAMLSGEELFGTYSRSETFLDLRNVLTPEQLEYYEDYFYYTDYALIESGYYDDYSATPFVDEADHHSPEGMENPVPVGIYVTCTSEFQEAYRFTTDEEIVFGFPATSKHLDAALQFLDIITGRAE